MVDPAGAFASTFNMTGPSSGSRSPMTAWCEPLVAVNVKTAGLASASIVEIDVAAANRLEYRALHLQRAFPCNCTSGNEIDNVRNTCSYDGTCNDNDRRTGRHRPDTCMRIGGRNGDDGPLSQQRVPSAHEIVRTIEQRRQRGRTAKWDTSTASDRSCPTLHRATDCRH